MKRILTVLSLLVITTFGKAAETDIPFVYVNEIGVMYKPWQFDKQPTVRILTRNLGYDMTVAEEPSVCVVVVLRLRGGDAPITPAAGSFLIWSDSQYLTPEEFENTSNCVSAGM